MQQAQTNFAASFNDNFEGCLSHIDLSKDSKSALYFKIINNYLYYFLLRKFKTILNILKFV